MSCSDLSKPIFANFYFRIRNVDKLISKEFMGLIFNQTLFRITLNVIFVARCKVLCNRAV